MPATATAPTAFVKITPAQQEYLLDLLGRNADKPGVPAIREALNARYAARTLSKEVASAFITSLVAIERAARPSAAPVVSAPAAMAKVAQAARQPYPVVRDGRYAVEVDGVLRFYFVTREYVTGKGQQINARRYMSDKLVEITGGEQVKALRLIEADPQAAQMAFARGLTRCYSCARMLTDPESIERGQGPDCAGK